ncbi:MAG: hypothetical protein JWM88_3411 [Verrucomicrobia bacterium]|nr:hypothetical protein [Verrucomicrobiota bacterium]
MRHRLALRRAVLVTLLVAASAAAAWKFGQVRLLYPRLAYLTGWILLGLMLLLTLYNSRKKLPFLPLLSSRLWLQAHAYVGLFTAVVFLLHLNGRAPSGWFEGVLAWLFVSVTASGIFGWWISRVLPKRMTTAGGEVLFERIPIVRRDLRLQAEALALKAIPEARATTLADFYTREVSAFFAEPQGFWSSLAGSRRRLTALLGSLAETKRYLTAAEISSADRLAELIRQKDAVDFQRSAQLVLKGWLFVHIPLTYGLLIFSLVHVMLVHAFAGGAR